MAPVKITYFSDVLCIWAYAAQARVDEIRTEFGNQVSIQHRFCSVFGDTHQKITSAWNGRGEYDGFNVHLREVSERFPHIAVHPKIWLESRPASSASAHLFLKAVEQVAEDATTDPLSQLSLFEKVNEALRLAFFATVATSAIGTCSVTLQGC